MGDTSIEWAGKVWNVVRGCVPVDEGCAGCYAAEIAARFSGPGLAFEGLGRRLGNGLPAWTGASRILPHKLLEPLRWRRGERVFVNSVSDLWWTAFPDSLILAHLAVAYLAPQHRYLCLTKRGERLRGWLGANGGHDPIQSAGYALAAWLTSDDGEGGPDVGPVADRILEALDRSPYRRQWPPPNWLQGVSIASEKSVGRVDELLAAGFACPWVSAEPLVGALEIGEHLRPRWRRGQLNGAGAEILQDDRRQTLRWAVIGGESGRRARPCAMEWIESLVDQGRDGGIPLFVKQLGSYVVSEGRRGLDEEWAWRAGLTDPKGGDPSEWPEELRIRQYPPEAIPDAMGPRYSKGWPMEGRV